MGNILIIIISKLICRNINVKWIIHLSRELLLLSKWRGDKIWDGLFSNSTLVSAVFDLAELKYFRTLRLFSLLFARRNNDSDKLPRLTTALCTGVR